MTKPNMDQQFQAFARKMRQHQLPEIFINNFKYYYSRLVQGQTGLISDADIEPVYTLPNIEDFDSKYDQIGANHISQVAIIKLNGGLGTSMGLDKPKSLLRAKDDKTFLEITVRQAQKDNVPLILMNSFNTREDSMAALNLYSDFQQSFPLDFVQHKVPKICQEDFTPVEWPYNPHLEWCPPGHGDLYTSLVTSGMLEQLLRSGYQYIFVSNIDNLGAVIDQKILGYFIENQLPFMMEVADRTEADKKGGHLAQQANGQLILREAAQCPEEDKSSFQNIKKYKYFNSNNLWINLTALKKVMQEKDNLLGLPMIRNRKTVDPRDENSPPVYQLETAMGSAIQVFPGAGAVRIPKHRFAPVKTTEDLLGLRSDVYQLTENFQVRQVPQRKLGTIVINLDPQYYKLFDMMDDQFAHGAPSLIDCASLTIEGNVKFGKNVKLKGHVHLINKSAEPKFIEDNSVIEGHWDV